MKGMILAAGFGTRLAPLTDTLPKALIPVAGAPMIRHAIEILRRAGCDEIVVNAHHFAARVEDYFRRIDIGMRVHVLHEREILGTGGGVLNAAPLLAKEDVFLLYNADIVCEADLAPLLRAMDSGKREGERPLAALLVNRRETHRALLFDARLRFAGKEAWIAEGLEPPGDVQRRGFCGVHAVSGELFRLGYPAGFSDIFDVYRIGMEKGYTLQGVETEAYWTDLGTPARITAYEERLRLREAR